VAELIPGVPKISPSSWSVTERGTEVAKFVMDISLDMIRVGGTGEQRLLARRHSAYGTGNGVELGLGRCASLIKPSPTSQLHAILKSFDLADTANPTSHASGGSGGRGGRRFVAFTITDATYGDMLNDVWAGVHRLGLDGSFFYVALDKPTALAACHHHMPVVYFSEPLALPDSKDLPVRSKKFVSTKDRVYEAK
jgi:hypothetical protein